MPAHRAMRDLLEAAGLPLAAPSANASGSISPTRVEHVARSLGGRIPFIIDDGATSLGLESTIVGLAGGKAQLLRPGPVTLDEIAGITGPVAIRDDADAISAPGQMTSHYAPSKPVRLDAIDARAGEWLIGFGPIVGDVSLSRAGDPVEAAARLFDLLHEADMQDRPAIAVAPIPADGLGLAINDRLQRAAAPR